MSSPIAQLSVAVEDDVVFVRVAGRATFAAGVDFKSLLENLIEKGHRRVAVDLSQCPIMDSTFIGLLTTFGMQLPPNADSGISLLNTNERIRGLLANLGVEHLFVTCSSSAGLPAHFAAHQAGDGPASSVELQRTCLQAHEKLMEANAGNIPRFKDVTRFLAEDLQKSGASLPDKPDSGG
jgi:anti-anti-sigma regulatory factor